MELQACPITNGKKVIWVDARMANSYHATNDDLVE